MIKIQSNTAGVAEKFLQVSREVEPEFEAVMNDMGEFTLQVLKRKVNYKTGKLRDSIQYKIERTSGGYQIKFTADATAKSDGSYYVNYVDQGTRPHVIRVRNAKALHFFDREGNERFAIQVYHPGYKGSHFSSKAAIEARRHADVVLKQLGGRISRRLAG
jgi:hypothetical protein